MTATLVLGLVVIILPGAVALMLVRSSGMMPGLLILGGMATWAGASWVGALNPGNAEVAPQIFGGEAIFYRQRTGIPEALWTVLILVPSTIWTAVAVLIGRASHRRRLQKDVPS